MKKSAYCFFAALAAAILLSACEDDSDIRGASFAIQPAQATIEHDNDSLILRAVGGQPPYTWSVSDASMGTVSTNSHAVTYWRTPVNGVNTVRVVDGQRWRAEMLVTQRGEPSTE